mmetsp:Transcript_38651/g.70344  ORF Transcript_38651/g.70344 Transcript_38651/m.70344 type:complete len:364 (+) Transcript_38651:152-1243(+)
MAKADEQDEDRWHWSAAAEKDDEEGAVDPRQPAGEAPEPAAVAPREVIHSERTRYFVITSNTMENVVKSVKHGLWATQRKNEAKLNEAFRQCPTVVLVFSVNGTETIQGYARMRSLIGQPANMSVDPFNGFGRLFNVEWLRLHDLPYHEVDSLRNPFNGDRPVRQSRDGQELSNLCGRALCGIIDRHIDDPQSFQAAPQPVAPHRAAEMPRSGTSGGRTTSVASHPQRQQEDMLALMPPGAADVESGPRTKRRKREKHYRNAPDPLTASFDEQLAFFLDLEYEEYVEWWQRRGSANPGPTAPPGSNIPAQLLGQAHPQVAPAPIVSSAPPLSPYNHLPPPHMGYYPGHQPPPFGAYPPLWQGA